MATQIDATLTVKAGATYTLQTASIGENTNDGYVGDGSPATLNLSTGNIVGNVIVGTNGSGVLNVSGTSSVQTLTLGQSGGSSGILNVASGSNFIVSAGPVTFGSGTSTINNHGTFSLNSLSGTVTNLNNFSDGTLLFYGQQSFANAITNQGVLAAASGATLNLNGTANNSGGSIIANAGGAVFIYGATLTGGTLAGAGAFNLSYGFLTNITNAAVITVPAGEPGAYLQGTIVNSGSITLATDRYGDRTNLNSYGVGMTLSGGGTVVISASGFVQTSGGGALVNVDNLIHGSGSISAAGGNIINQGTIAADSQNQMLTLTASGSYTISNTGTLTTSGGGILYLNCAINNVGGTISSSAGGTVEMAGGAVTGGTFTGPGTINFYQGFLTNVTNMANATVPLSGSVYLQGAIVNTGSITFLTDGDQFDRAALITNGSGTTTLSGGGTITMAAPGYIQTGGGTLINVDNFIHGSGTIYATAGNVVNQGMIAADANHQTLTLSNGGSYKFTNTGTLTASNGGTLTINSSVDNTGGSIIAGAGGTVYLYGTITGTVG